MRKIVLSIAAAGAALIAASPATAQYYPQPQPYGYNGYNNGFGQVRALQARIDNVERQINRLDRRDRIGDRNADRLRDEANRIEDRLHRAARGGLNPYEAREPGRSHSRRQAPAQAAADNIGRQRDLRGRGPHLRQQGKERSYASRLSLVERLMRCLCAVPVDGGLNATVMNRSTLLMPARCCDRAAAAHQGDEQGETGQQDCEAERR